MQAGAEFDPTNDCLAGEGHVLVYGRDYGDVPPLRGVIRGGGNHQLAVAVTVSPQAQTQRRGFVPGRELWVPGGPPSHAGKHRHD